MDLLTPLLRFQAGAAGGGWLWPAALALVWAGGAPGNTLANRRRVRLGLGALAAAALGALLLDPLWPGLAWLPPAVGLLAALSAPRAFRNRAVLVLAAALALGWKLGAPARARDRAAAAEAAFLKSRLSSADLVLALSEPDRAFVDALAGGPEWSVVARTPEPELRRRLGRAKVWLASDWLFRPAGAPVEEQARAVDAALRRLTPAFSLGAPVSSPAGLAYYPLAGAAK